jgi:hypothetical protein
MDRAGDLVGNAIVLVLVVWMTWEFLRTLLLT